MSDFPVPRGFVPPGPPGPLGPAMYAPPGPTTQDQGLTGKDILRVLRKRMWLIIIPIVLFTIMAVVGTHFWLKHAPSYTAAAYLSVNPPSEGIFSPRRAMVATDIIERLVRSQAQMVTAEGVLNRTIKMDQVRRTEWYRDDPSSAVERLTDSLTVNPLPDTNLIRVSVSGRGKEEIPELANAIAEAFVEDTVQSARSANQSELALLTEEMNSIKRELDDVRQDKVRTLAGVEAATLQGKGGVLGTQLRNLGMQLSQYRREEALKKTTLDELKAQMESGALLQHPQVLFELQRNNQYVALSNREMALTLDLEAKMRKYHPTHPDVITLQETLNTARQQLEELRDRLAKGAAKAVLERERLAWEGDRAQILQLEQDFRAKTAEASDVERILNRVETLNVKENSLDREFTRLAARERELRMESSTDRPVEIRRRAETPREPSSPKWKVNIPDGMMLGLMLGLGLALLLEFTDTSIKTPQDVTRKIDVAVLGMVPHMDDIEDEIDDVRTAVLNHSDTLICEAFRRIRTSLLFSAAAEHRRSVLITSPLPEDGRTSVAMNLGASLAKSGKRVMIIDSNFRQPTLTELSTEKDPDHIPAGLSNVLVGQVAWSDAIQHVQPSLHVLPAGPMPPNPAELLGSERMRETLQEMYQHYDQVLVDGAPSLVVTDPTILGSIVDSVLLVVRAGSNTHGIVQRSKEMLARAGARVLGVVLNGVKSTAGGYLRENYATFYEYNVQPKLPESSTV